VWTGPPCRNGSSPIIFGRQYFDIAALDVYHSDFNPAYYHDLLKLADGKPVTLAEVGPPPTVGILNQQPKWTWWMQWAGMEGRAESTSNAVQALFDDPRSYSLSDPGYRRAITPVRAVAGLPPLPPVAASETH